MSEVLKVLENEVQIAALLFMAAVYSIRLVIKHYKLDMKVGQVLELVANAATAGPAGRRLKG